MPAFDDSRLTLPAGGDGLRLQVTGGIAALHKEPRDGAVQVSQLLHGETLTMHHEEKGFALVQNETDRYVGWARVGKLAASVIEPTHRVKVTRLHAYSAPHIQATPNALLGMGARLASAGEEEGAYHRFERVGWIAKHLVAPIESVEDDPAAVAEQFLGTPYLWGGRDCYGIDCSGLVQIAFGACGVICPRDSDMQRDWLGEPITDWDTSGMLQRGDLIFWKGHVGIMLDAESFLHSNGTFMTTMAEPLVPAIERIAKEYGEPLGARRINLSEAVGVAPDWLTAQA